MERLLLFCYLYYSNVCMHACMHKLDRSLAYVYARIKYLPENQL